MVWACGDCGGENPDRTRFCGHCGRPAPVDDAPAGRTTEAPPTTPEVSDALRRFVSGQVADRLLESSGEIAEERRLVTCLFADISGFTPLADRLDPEQLLDVIDPVINRLTNIVGRYEGYVDKFAGDALLAFFGAPISHEDDAERALLVALEMHEALAAAVGSLPEIAQGLTLHAGVNSGHVVARVLGTDVRMDYSVLGDAVILAQRLESNAPAGETFVGEQTFGLTRGRFDFESVGELALKGKAEPVSAWRLVGPKRVHTAAAAPPLVGRTHEAVELSNALTDLAEGRGSVVVITGEPGVGKSVLTHHARQEAKTKDIRWLTARCLSYGQGIAYWPFAEAIRGLVGIDTQVSPEEAKDRLHAALASAAIEGAEPYLARLIGLPADEIRELEPEAYRRELHRAFVSAVGVLGDERPTVVAVEDLHWADEASVALAADLVRATLAAPTMVYTTARPEASAALDRIGRGVPGEMRLRIDLAPFEPEDVASLVRSVLGGPAPDGLVELVAERSGGNPFFVDEIVKGLRESGALIRTQGAWNVSGEVGELVVPPTVEGVLAARIDRLSRRDASVLQVSSVIGRRVRVSLLSALEQDPPDLAGVLERLVTAGFLDPSDSHDEFIFHHALVQDVAYGRLLRRHRRDLHGRLAEVAEGLYGAGDDSIDLLARHLYLADAGTKAIRYLMRAGRRARSMFANDDAMVHLKRAGELARKDPDCTDLLHEVLLEVADLYELRADYEKAFALYEEVRDSTGSVRAWRGMAATLRSQGRYDDALSHIVDAFASAGKSRQETSQLWLERGWALGRLGRWQEAIAAFKDGLRELGDRHGAAGGELLLQLAAAQDAAEDYEVALDNALEAREIFKSSEDLRNLAAAMRVVGGLQQVSGRHDEAVRTLSEGLALAERTGNVEQIAGILINLGMAEMARGSLDEAIVCDRKAIEWFERVDHSSGRAIAYGNLAEKLMLNASYEDALAFSARAVEIAESIGHLPTIADATMTQAAARVRLGELGTGAELAERAGEVYERMGVGSLAAEAYRLAADAFRRADQLDRAGAAIRRARTSAAATPRR